MKGRSWWKRSFNERKKFNYHDQPYWLSEKARIMWGLDCLWKNKGRAMDARVGVLGKGILIPSVLYGSLYWILNAVERRMEVNLSILNWFNVGGKWMKNAQCRKGGWGKGRDKSWSLSIRTMSSQESINWTMECSKWKGVVYGMEKAVCKSFWGNIFHNQNREMDWLHVLSNL